MSTNVTKENLQEFATKLHAKNKTIFATKAQVGSPLVASTAAGMTDTDKIYVYTGSETGYTSGNWYYYDGEEWQSGGVYNAEAVETDTTLSVSGMAADAKAVGDEFTKNLWGVPLSVREAIYALLNNAAYASIGMADEISVVESWACEVYSLTISASTLSLNESTLYGALTAMVVPSTVPVSWSSSDTSVAIVSNGVVSAVSNGSCVITATAGGLTATCSVTVSGITLQSISATYTQTQYVFTDTPLDDLKTDLIVTGLYSSGVTAEVDSENYTLSGTLAVGTSTITVTCGEVTTTFTTTVTQTYQVATYPYTFVPSAEWAGSWNNSTQTGQVRGAGASSYPGLILQGLQYKFSVVKTMHLRVKITITLSDTIVDEAGLLFNLGLFDVVNPANASSNRKASKVPFKQLSAGAIVWERIYALSEQFTGTGLDNYYLGLALLFNAPNSASVTASFSNISLEVF